MNRRDFPANWRKNVSEENAVYGSNYKLPQTLISFKRLPCALPFADHNYEPPSAAQIDQLIKLAGWSQNETAKLTGVTWNPLKGSTTVRKWRTEAGSEKRQISYSSWRLLLLNAKVVNIDPFEVKNYKSVKPRNWKK